MLVDDALAAERACLGAHAERACVQVEIVPMGLARLVGSQAAACQEHDNRPVAVAWTTRSVQDPLELGVREWLAYVIVHPRPPDVLEDRCPELVRQDAL